MSLARRHQARILAAQTATLPSRVGSAAAGSPLPAAAPPIDLGRSAETAVRLHDALSALAAKNAPNRAAETAAAQIVMRLTHDLRRLKEIKSVAAKIEAKREMLPEYHAWCDGLLEAGRMTIGDKLTVGVGADVLPTMMIWSIDVADWPRALELAAHVLRFGVSLPHRYQRDAASLLVEETAEAALKAQAKDEAFPLDVLEQVELLTVAVDMHDEIRAKLMKAIGVELDRAARAAAEAGEPALPLLTRSLSALREAQDLHERVGVKTIIRGVEKAIDAANKTAGEAG